MLFSYFGERALLFLVQAFIFVGLGLCWEAVIDVKFSIVLITSMSMLFWKCFVFYNICLIVLYLLNGLHKLL